jgi:hypothetical protein
MCPKFVGHNSKQTPGDSLSHTRGLWGKGSLSKKISQDPKTESDHGAVDPSAERKGEGRGETSNAFGKSWSSFWEGVVHPQVPKESKHEDIFSLKSDLEDNGETKEEFSNRERGGWRPRRESFLHDF